MTKYFKLRLGAFVILFLLLVGNSCFASVVLDSYITPNSMQRCSIELEKLPEHIRNELQSWDIILTQKDIPSNFLNRSPNYGIRVATEYKKHRIIVRSSEIEKALIHEIGHFLDWKMKYISDNPEFMMIYKSECAQFRAHSQFPRVMINAEEFFAEVFAAVIKKEARVIYAPKATEFIKNLIWS